MTLYPVDIPGSKKDCFHWFDLEHHHSGNREWYAEKVRNNKNLLICIGDSWTWGDSLGKSHEAPLWNDVETRHRQFYTNLLAERLQADWMMIAWCGTNNHFILEQYDTINTAIKQGVYSNYEKVYVHVCLTEMFRDLMNLQSVDGNYFMPNNKTNFHEFTKEYFKHFVIDKLEELGPIPDTHTFSKNFWNIDFDVSGYNFVDRTWQDLLFEKDNIEGTKNIPVVSGMGIEPLTDYLKKHNLREIESQFSESLVDILALVKKMIGCKYNNEKATKHPTAEGHRIWADYLSKFY